MPGPVLILPGYENSGPHHWQSLWEQSDPLFERVNQRDWDRPVCEEWCTALDVAAARSGPDTVVVAHSLGCLVVAHWAAGSHAPIKAALLVAVPDSDGPGFPKAASGFSYTPVQAFPFGSIVVASTNDPYGSLEHASRLANAWESQLFNIGDCGHINAESGLGAWPFGFELLTRLRE